MHSRCTLMTAPGLSPFSVLMPTLALFLVLGMLLPQAALAWGEIRVATTDLNVRTAPQASAPKVLTLTEGQEIKVDFIQGRWAALFPLDAPTRDESKTIGYANIKYLKYVRKAPEVSPDADLVVHVQPEPLAAPAPKAVSSPVVSEPSSEVVRTGEGEVVARVQQHVDEVDAAEGGDAKPPVKITSDRMVYNEAKGTVVFEGNVRTDHLDLVLHSQTLTAYFAAGPGKKTGVDQIERIVASGNVKATRKTTVGTCQTLTYVVQDGILRMEGDPVLQDGDNVITGQVIRFYLKDNRSEVEGGQGKQVRAVFTAPGDMEP